MLRAQRGSNLTGLVLAAGSLCLWQCGGAQAASATAADGEAAFRSLYRELVEINTTLSSGSCTEAAQAMAARLQAAGMPKDSMRILMPPDRPKSGALIAILPGRDASLQPIMLLAHIDVVEAKREDWERDPFKLVEEDGFFFARGASDDKAMAAVFTDILVRFQGQGFKPRRPVKLALTCGEETSATFDSVHWLLGTQPDVLKAKFVLNEGAGGMLGPDGKPVSLDIQAGEKVYQDFTLETTNRGGHSSRPVRDNAINQLAAGLTRLAAYEFPISLGTTTRAYFEAQVKLSPPEIAADMRAVLKDPPDAAAAERLWTANPGWNGTLRTTCVATEIEGGHAPNALPQRARANVNCRILPGVPVESVQEELGRILADEGIKISRVGETGISAPVPPLTPQIMDPAKEVAAGIWPGVPVIPTMSTGGTDGRFLNAAGIPTYGLSGMFSDIEGSHAHGLNERMRVQSLMDGRRFLYEVVKIYAQQKD
jgi:acetylornithine deacetylase/succinyl-diaminopimelate desuccinylase-like protein